MYECCSCEAYINKWSKPYGFNLLDVILPMQRRLKELTKCSISPWAPLLEPSFSSTAISPENKIPAKQDHLFAVRWVRTVWLTEEPEPWLSRKKCVHKEIVGCSCLRRSFLLWFLTLVSSMTDLDMYSKCRRWRLKWPLHRKDCYFCKVPCTPLGTEEKEGKKKKKKGKQTWK